MNTQNTIKVMLVGETWIVSKFHIKGFDIVPLGGYEDFGIWLREALDPYPDLHLTHLPNHMVLNMFPKDLEELQQYNVLVLSDVGRNTLTLYPDFFKVPMGPDRLQLIRDFVEKGGSLIMCGGWMSFQGFQAKANYHGSSIEEVLPVHIEENDDRVETTEGVRPEILLPDHPVLEGIPKDEWPPFLGYNRLKSKDGADLIARCGNDVFIAVWQHGSGRTMAFASDLAPHWGSAFVQWKYYSQFWHQTMTWLASTTE